MCVNCHISLEKDYPLILADCQKAFRDIVEKHAKRVTEEEGRKLNPLSVLRANIDVAVSVSRAMIAAQDDDLPIPIHKMQVQQVQQELVRHALEVGAQTGDIDVLMAAMVESLATILEAQSSKIKDEFGDEAEESSDVEISESVSDFLSRLSQSGDESDGK